MKSINLSHSPTSPLLASPTHLRHLSPTFPPTLTSLSLWDHIHSTEDPGTHEALDVMLTIIGAHLDALQVRCTTDNHAPEVPLPLLLSPMSGHCPNLSSLVVYGGFGAELTILEALARNCPELKSVELDGILELDFVILKGFKHASMTVFADVCEQCGSKVSVLTSSGEWEETADGRKLKVDVTHHCVNEG